MSADTPASDFESLLEQAIRATPKAKSPDQGEPRVLVDVFPLHTGKVDRDMIRTIEGAIHRIDQIVSQQLAEILHHPAFQTLEGSWRGLHYLVHQSETNELLRIEVLNCDKRALFDDVMEAEDPFHSALFQKVYQGAFNQLTVPPYGVLIGDFEFTHHVDDVALLEGVSQIAAEAFCPFITSPAPQMFGFDNWTELAQTHNLTKIFETQEYIQWRAFRESEESRFVAMAMPRTLARLPYGKATKPIDEFDFEEIEAASGAEIVLPHDQYCWMNTAYVFGARLTDAFAKTGWLTAIRGAENGGKVQGLPGRAARHTSRGVSANCPTEVALDDRHESELSRLGFLPLYHVRNTDDSVFFVAQTAHKPERFGPRNPEAAENAAIAARLPFVMVTSRIVHYLKCMVRDNKVDSLVESQDLEDWLNRWFSHFITADQFATPVMKTRYPFGEARIQVKQASDQSCAYDAQLVIWPWLAQEELHGALSVTFRLDRRP